MTANASIEQRESGPVLTVSKAEAAVLGLREGSSMTAVFEAENVVLVPGRRHKYTADELLAQCDFSLPISDEDREWLNSPPVGRELI